MSPSLHPPRDNRILSPPEGQLLQLRHFKLHTSLNQIDVI